MSAIGLFFGGVFLANALLHLAMAVARRPFPTPFATPPFRGLSSPLVNLGYGAANLAVSALLLWLGSVADASDVVIVAAGVVFMTVIVARSLQHSRRDGQQSSRG